MDCPLCLDLLIHKLDERHFECAKCRAVVKNDIFHPTPDEEKKHYEAHNNDVNDIRYQQFVSPITNYVIANFDASHKGLDFGSGTGPVLSKMLSEAGFDMMQYDPYFANHPEVLEEKYDFIVCCEVIEHFYHPCQEFTRLRSMLKPGGQLICMTLLYSDAISFNSWPYKLDITHVFIYTAETIQFIAANFGFDALIIQDRLVVLKSE